jgi:hypothetical protein
MKIRITGATLNTYWYEDAIGKIYTVLSTDEVERKYKVDGGWYVDFEDCEEVIEHNSQLYRKVDRPVREGDTVLITLLQHTITYEIRKVKEVPGANVFVVDKPIIFGDDRVVGDDGTYGDDYDVLELIEQPVQPSAPSYAEVSELIHEAKGDAALVFLTDNHRVIAQTQNQEDTVTHNGKQYRKVKRKAAVGELVIGIDQEDYIASVDGYIVGNVYMVTRLTEESDGTIKYDVDDMFSDGTPLFLYGSEFNVLELVEQSGQDELLTVNDLLANLAQEVAELKRQLTNAKTDIADLEDRVDENEKDVEEVEQNLSEVIGRINDLGDGSGVSVDLKVLINELKERQVEANNYCDLYENMGDKEMLQFFDGKAIGFKIAARRLEEALRNA